MLKIDIILNMSIKDSIGSYKVQNLGGTRASKGFSYQNHWAIKKIVELHTSQQDYVVLFEVYDDISILDNESNPSKIDIYQVKSSQNQSPITFSKLSKKIKQEKSILAKLFLTKIQLPKELNDIVEKMFIVSNSSYQCRTKFHSSSNIEVSVLDHYKPEIKSKKIDELSKQSGIESSEIENLLKMTFLIKSPISFDEPHRQVRDILQEFFKERFKDFFDVTPFYTELLTEISNRCESEKIDGYDGTIKSKAITKKWLDGILKQITPDLKQQKRMITQELSKEGWGPEKIIKLEEEWRQMEIDNFNDKDYFNGKIIKVLDTLILKLNLKHKKYSDITEVILKEIKNNNQDIIENKKDYYLKALILWRTLDHRIKILEN